MLSGEEVDKAAVIAALDGAMDDVEEDHEDKEDELVKTMRSEETKRLLEANDMKWKTEMIDFKESLEIEHKKEVEAVKSQYEEQLKTLQETLRAAQKERERAEFDLKNTSQLFAEYKTRTNKTFESGREFRKEHENCDAEIFRLKAEVEKLKYENTRLKEDAGQPQ